jgi:hypothetical protein
MHLIFYQRLLGMQFTGNVTGNVLIFTKKFLSV